MQLYGKLKGESPLDQQGDASPGAKESTPTQPGGRTAGAQPQASPSPGHDGQPSSPGPDPQGDAQNVGGGPPPKLGTASAAPAADTRDRWGDLPVQVRDIFRTEATGDLPPRYRDWIDAYYRRLNSRP